MELLIKEKIEKIGTPLKDWDIQINYGVKTGFNDAFIIDGAKRRELIKQDPKSEEIIRPILRGRDIKRYSYDFADLWILFIPWHFPLHTDSDITGASDKAEIAFKTEFPAVYNHLLKYKKELENRNKAETGIRYEWYALQRWGANYWNDFLKQKIVWLCISDKPVFAIDDENKLCNNAVYFIASEYAKYLCCILNNKIIEWYFDKICTHTGVGTNKWEKFVVELIPIPKISSSNRREFETLLDQLRNKKEKKEDFKEIEAEINAKVFALYELSKSEIDLIIG